MNQIAVTQKKDGMRSSTDSTLEVLPAEDTLLVTLEELWANMPVSSKQYYNYDIDVYRHHKIIQLMRDNEE